MDLENASGHVNLLIGVNPVWEIPAKIVIARIYKQWISVSTSG